MDTPFRDVGKDGEVAVMIKEEMELDRSLRLAEGGPVKEGEAELDDRSVEAEELVLEAELLLPRGNSLALPQQLVEDLLVKLPGSFLIGIGQGGTARSVFYTKMLELAEAARKPTADLP